MVKVAVVGYGVIGQRLADGVGIGAHLSHQHPRPEHPGGGVVGCLAGHAAGVAPVTPLEIDHHPVTWHLTGPLPCRS